jgi:pyrroloquinoline-quinone synthase
MRAYHLSASLINEVCRGGSKYIDHRWSALLKPEWVQRLRDTRFLTRCRTGAVSRMELHLFVRQHYHYSKHFTRYLGGLLSNLHEELARVALTRNLFDEMGMSGGTSHAEIYRRMMAAMFLGDEGDVGAFPATQALVETMLECCGSPRAMVGLGALCLGAEAIVPEVYTTIMSGFEAVQEPRENLEFFALHILDDDEHALTMREIILRELARDPHSRLDLEYGAARAISARVSFFEAISEQSTLDQYGGGLALQFQRFR